MVLSIEDKVVIKNDFEEKCWTIWKEHPTKKWALNSIHDMHHFTLDHGPNSQLVASDVLTDFTSLATDQLLGLQKTLQWCIS